MKTQVNFWTLAVMMVLCLGFSSCEKNNENIDNEEINSENDELYKSLILGEWDFSSGSLGGVIGNNEDEILSQKLTFVTVGNYSEENFLRSKTDKHNGNWLISGGKILLNDWNGKPFGNAISIIALSENRLEISYLNSKTVYLKAGTDLANLRARVLGYWYEFSDRSGKPFYEFKNDGIVRHRTYQYIDNSPIAQEGQYEWEIDGNKLTLTTLPVRYRTVVYTVKYCNDKYLRLESNEQKIALKREQ